MALRKINGNSFGVSVIFLYLCSTIKNTVMKSYTDLEQSKKLAEILPLESADMCWTNHCYGRMRSSMTISAKSIYEYKKLLERFADSTSLDVFYPAWSLCALYSVLPTFTFDSSDDKYFRIHCCNKFSEWYNNPVDACYEMILKLHELNLL